MILMRGSGNESKKSMTKPPNKIITNGKAEYYVDIFAWKYKGSEEVLTAFVERS